VCRWPGGGRIEQPATSWSDQRGVAARQKRSAPDEPEGLIVSAYYRPPSQIERVFNWIVSVLMRLGVGAPTWSGPDLGR